MKRRIADLEPDSSNKKREISSTLERDAARNYSLFHRETRDSDYVECYPEFTYGTHNLEIDQIKSLVTFGTDLRETIAVPLRSIGGEEGETIYPLIVAHALVTDTVANLKNNALKQFKKRFNRLSNSRVSPLLVKSILQGLVQGCGANEVITAVESINEMDWKNHVIINLAATLIDLFFYESVRLANGDRGMVITASRECKQNDVLFRSVDTLEHITQANFDETVGSQKNNKHVLGLPYYLREDEITQFNVSLNTLDECSVFAVVNGSEAEEIVQLSFVMVESKNICKGEQLRFCRAQPLSEGSHSSESTDSSARLASFLAEGQESYLGSTVPSGPSSVSAQDSRGGPSNPRYQRGASSAPSGPSSVSAQRGASSVPSRPPSASAQSSRGGPSSVPSGPSSVSAQDSRGEPSNPRYQRGASSAPSRPSSVSAQSSRGGSPIQRVRGESSPCRTAGSSDSELSSDRRADLIRRLLVNERNISQQENKLARLKMLRDEILPQLQLD